MNHVIVNLIFLIVLTFGKQLEADGHKSPDYVRYAQNVMRTSAKRIAKELNLTCIGSGGGMPYNVREMDLEFVSHEEGTIEKARELEVKATEIFLNEINSHEAIRPYLDVYPFTVDRANVYISFQKKNNRLQEGNSVTRVVQINNTVYYDHRRGLEFPALQLHKEPYEEARKIVQASQE